MSQFVTEGKVFNAVVTAGVTVYTSSDVKVYNSNRRAPAHTSLFVYSTQAGTVTVEVQLEQGGAWYAIVSGATVALNTLYNAELAQMFYAVRMKFTNGGTAGVLNGWVYSA